LRITIVGLGPGHVDDVSRRAWNTLDQAHTVYLRTAHHGCVPHLPQQNTTYITFDEIYDSLDDFDAIHQTITERLIYACQQDGDVIYAVPGDPLVGESTTTRLLSQAHDAGIEIRIIHGISFIEPMLAAMGIDALDGVQIYEGGMIAMMHHPPINPDMPALVGQVYNRHVASDLKLTLMNQYPDDYQVSLIHFTGTGAVQVETLPLYEIDRSDTIADTTALFIPAMQGMNSFERFQDIIAHLRDPENGCPWDLKQTHESLRQYLLEEAYETLEAIDTCNTDELYRELGDVLLQIVLHTQVAIDDSEFYMTDVLRHINEKMIRRHPHVFGTVDVDNADDVVMNWDAIKAQEKADSAPESLLDSVPKALPALLRAFNYQERAARAGFDWPVIDGVREKINEELDEVLSAPDDENRQEELGDLFFILVNWARWLKIDPENALRLANDKFYRRFAFVEAKVRQTGQPMSDFTLEALDVFWDEAKAQGL
jgi:tetrapyrrole methylase family protein/MazG family protein